MGNHQVTRLGPPSEGGVYRSRYGGSPRVLQKERRCSPVWEFISKHTYYKYFNLFLHLTFYVPHTLLGVSSLDPLLLS